METTDTKGTKELIEALNPESELRAVARKEEEFIERRRLEKDDKRKSVFRRGINYLGQKTRNASRYIGQGTAKLAKDLGQGLRGTRKAIGSLFQKPLPKPRNSYLMSKGAEERLAASLDTPYTNPIIEPLLKPKRIPRKKRSRVSNYLPQ